MKRKLFIGSSSESMDLAKKVKKAIDKCCSDWIETSIWNENGIFELNVSTLSNLVKKTRIFDYGVFIADADDCVLQRDSIHEAARDNVIFELGLFMGAMGLNRAFVVTSVKLPSDMNGATIIKYKNRTISRKGIEQLVQAIENTKKTYKLGHRTSTALALGYYNNFVKPTIDTLAQKGTDFKLEILIPRNISDLPNRIKKYAEDTGGVIEKLIPNGRNVYRRSKDSSEYWDIPRLLRTLEDILSFYEPKDEPGTKPAYEELLSIELENFFHVLFEINKQGNAYAQNLRILMIDF